MKTLKFYLIAIAALCLFSACSEEPALDEQPGGDNVKDEELLPDVFNNISYFYASLTDKELKLNSNLNDFSVRVFKAIDGSVRADESYVFSPVTETLNQVMIANAADEAYRSKILKEMSFSDMATLNDLTSRLCKALPLKGNGAFVSIATGIWVDNQHTITPQYEQQMSQLFNAGLGNYDFADPSTAGLINQWCSKHTDGMISDLVDHNMIKDAEAAWTSTLYFNGQWSSKFNKVDTKAEKFATPAGEVDVMMMHHEDMNLGSYANVSGYEYASWAFSGSTVFHVILPPADADLSNTLEEMPAVLMSYISAKATTPVDIRDHLHVAMPRFKIMHTQNFSDIYLPWGLTTNKMPGVGIEALKNGGLAYLQKATIEVDEDGAKAAAAAITGLTTDSGRPYEPKDYYITLNRPFYFVISDRNLGTILYAGRITDPGVYAE